MNWKEIKAKQEERGKLLSDARKYLETAATEKRSLNDEESGKFDSLHKQAEDIKGEIERYETQLRAQHESSEIEKRSQVGRSEQPNADGEKSVAEQAPLAGGKRKLNAVEERAVDSYLRGKLTLREVSDNPETRAVAKSDLGVVGTREFDPNIVVGLQHIAGVLQAGARVITTSNGEPFVFPTVDEIGSGAVYPELATIAQEDPDFGNKTLSAHKYSSKIIRVSREALQDAAFDLSGLILDIANERTARLFNNDTTVGNGSGKARGFLLDTAAGVTSAATNAITYGEIISLVHSVDPLYRAQNATLMMNDSTLAYIRKMTDDSGAPLWSANAPFDSILGMKYVVNNNMPEVSDGAGSKVIAYGNFSRYYVRQVGAPYVARLNELYAETDSIGFVVHRRLDGLLADSKAIKHLAMAA